FLDPALGQVIAERIWVNSLRFIISCLAPRDARELTPLKDVLQLSHNSPLKEETFSNHFSEGTGRSDLGMPFDNFQGKTIVQSPNRLVVCIADEHKTASFCEESCSLRESNLIIPAKDLGVVFHKPIIPVCHSVWRIEVDQVPSFSLLGYPFEISPYYLRALQGGTRCHDALRLSRIQVRFFPVWD